MCFEGNWMRNAGMLWTYLVRCKNVNTECRSTDNQFHLFAAKMGNLATSYPALCIFFMLMFNWQHLVNFRERLWFVLIQKKVSSTHDLSPIVTKVPLKAKPNHSLDSNAGFCCHSPALYTSTSCPDDLPATPCSFSFTQTNLDSVHNPGTDYVCQRNCECKLVAYKPNFW